MIVLNDVVGYKNMKIYQDTEFFKFSLDSLILANYTNIKLSDKKICDIGTGNGIVPIILSRRTQNDIYCVEIQKKLYDLAIMSFKENNILNRIHAFNCDVADSDKFCYNEYFDLILCNPPYFKITDSSYKNLSTEKLIARHEKFLDIEKLLFTAKRLLKSGGRIVIVHRPERLSDIISFMKYNNIEPKNIRFVHENPNKIANVILIEGVKNGKVGMKIEPPLILFEGDSESDEYRKLLTEVRK